MLAEGLVDALKVRGHRAELVALPFQWQPHDELFKSALAWRLLDLKMANGVRVDRIITTKFPSYAAQHPHKVACDLAPRLLVGIGQHVCRCSHPAVGPPERLPQVSCLGYGTLDDSLHLAQFGRSAPFSSTRAKLSPI